MLTHNFLLSLSRASIRMAAALISWSHLSNRTVPHLHHHHKPIIMPPPVHLSISTLCSQILHISTHTHGGVILQLSLRVDTSGSQHIPAYSKDQRFNFHISAITEISTRFSFLTRLKSHNFWGWQFSDWNWLPLILSLQALHLYNWTKQLLSKLQSAVKSEKKYKLFLV